MAEDTFFSDWGLSPADLPKAPDVGVGPTKSFDENSFDKEWLGTPAAVAATTPVTPEHKFGLMDTWPVRLAKAIGQGLTAPGNALQSTPENPVTTEQMVGPAGNLASIISTGGIPSVLSKSAPLIDPAIAGLMQKGREEFGIPIRGSQFAPGMKRTDLAASNKPFTGFEANTAEQQAAFNRQINKTMGVEGDKVTPDTLQQVRDNYRTTIDDVTERVGKLKFDDAAHNEILDTFREANINIPDKIQTIQNKIKEIAANVDNNGYMNAKTYKGLMRKDGPLDPSKYDGMLQHHVEMLRDNLKDVLRRNATKEDVAALDRANQQYAVMKSVKPLVDKSPTGDISPPSLMRVTPSYGALSDLAKIGQVMKPATSSGTAENMSAFQKWGLMSGLGGLEGAMMWHDPMLALKVSAGAATVGGSKALWNALYGKYLRSDYLANKLIDRSLPNRIPSVNPLQKLVSGSASGYALPASAVPQIPFQFKQEAR